MSTVCARISFTVQATLAVRLAHTLLPMPLPRHFHLVHDSPLRRSAIAVIVLAGVAAALLWGLSWTPPAWYDPEQVTEAPAPEVEDLAERVEYRVVEEAQRLRPEDQEWTVLLREEQANAWLAVRLPKWIEHDRQLEWPEKLLVPQMRFRDGSLSIALGFMPKPDDRPRIITAEMVPVISEDGLRLQLASLKIGRIRLPGDPLERLQRTLEQLVDARQMRPEDAELLTQFLSGVDPLPLEIKLSDGRHVELVNTRIEDGQALITCRTLPEEPTLTGPVRSDRESRTHSRHTPDT